MPQVNFYVDFVQLGSKHECVVYVLKNMYLFSVFFFKLIVLYCILIGVLRLQSAKLYLYFPMSTFLLYWHSLISLEYW